LETRRLHALPREKAVDRLAVHAKDAADADRVEPTVVDQPPDRLRVHTELIRYLANADEPGLSICSRQDLAKPRRFSAHACSRRRTADSSSRDEIEPSNFALIRPSRPTRNVQGSDGRRHSRTQRFSPFRGSLSL
jgi:hypothetical protein